MSTPEPSSRPLSAADREVLAKLKAKAWTTLLRFYVPLFLLLMAVYFKMRPAPGGGYVGHSYRTRRENFDIVFPYFATFFSALFLGFLIKDFRRLILPFLREEKLDQKICRSFVARKYHDPLYDKRLLFYPDKDNYYISISPDDFDSIVNGQELYLEVASITGEVLVLRSDDRQFMRPEEFSFSDQ